MRSEAVSGRALRDRSTPEGQFGQHAPPNEAAIRRYVDEGRCPWCGAGPYKILAVHTARKHGIDRLELRRRAGLPIRASICDVEIRDRVLARRASGDLLPKSKPPLQPNACPACGAAIQPRSRRAEGHQTCGRPECVTVARNRKPRRVLTPGALARVDELLAAGRRIYEAADAVGIARGTLYDHLRRTRREKEAR